MTRIYLFLWNLLLKIRIWFLIKYKYKSIRYFKRWDSKINKYKKTFGDDFIRPLSISKWRTDLYTGLNYNIDSILDDNEAPNEYYNGGNLCVKNGVLNFETKLQGRLIDHGENMYTIEHETGLINSSNSFLQYGGYFEFRAKMSTERGMGFKCSLKSLYDNSLDISIFDINTNNRNIIVNSVTKKNGKRIKVKKTSTRVLDLSKGYFIYGCKWESKYLKFYFQDILIGVLKIPKDYDDVMYINIQPTVNTRHVQDNTISLDYIRVYKKLDI